MIGSLSRNWYSIVIGGYSIPTLFASPEPKWPTILPNKLQLLEVKSFLNDKLWLRYKTLQVEAVAEPPSA